MEFTPLEIEGAFGISDKSHSDPRGTLTRIWEKNSILRDFNLVQSSIVTNPAIGTLRGLHYQAEPFTENKVVECITGKVFDVIFDMRQDSKTYREHITVQIGPSQPYLGLFVPAGCAHGYLTLQPHSTLVYFMDNVYSKENSRGIPWNDDFLRINWPFNPLLLSEQDASWPNTNLK
jgi:dTDP-4-dehydrorhamnose 3,5-epimerase